MIFVFESSSNQDQESSSAFQIFEIAELEIDRENSGELIYQFLDEPSMKGSILEIAIGENDSRSSNPSDELYYFLTGNALFQIGQGQIEIEPGMILYVRGGQNRQIIEISLEIKVIVLTMTGPANLSVPNFKSYTKAKIESPRSATANVWNPFLQQSNVILGLYLLPRVAGGDGRLVHSFDELNIVTAGSAKFQVGSEIVDVKEGTIMFVREGRGHWFHSLTEDTDILILWDQP
jgi:mannose-6-phosphate isomerase-like protein (cupin superfamily)